MEKMFYLAKNNMDKLRENIVNHRKKYQDIISIPDNIKFGIEIEFLSPYSLKDILEEGSKTSYEFRYDGMTVTSVLEAISPVLTNKKETWEELRRVLNIIKSSDAYVDERVGAHIHFDNTTIGDENVVSFLKLWYVFEEVIYQFSYGEFDHLRADAVWYANRLNIELKNCLDEYENGDKDLSNFSVFDKGYGINLENHLCGRPYPWKDTYEIRCPNGTIDKDVWQNNINFFAHLLLFGANKNNRQIINKFYKDGRLENSATNAITLADMVYENDDDKLDFLKQYKFNLTDSKNEQKVYCK